ncbi:Family of serine hydrolases 3 [Mucor velutinosus]|uniref:Family of serine hydrolases 3 n=1 Tax=Mucor velutinosus TaxID=708070 RepID=A0AAN7HKR0_9FUNG|nr:Family of serine hydrolases 3 [Mucor velutinosus]
MPSYFLLTLTLVLVALFASHQVSAAAIGNQNACIQQAYRVYDFFTKNGCDIKKGEEACRNSFDFAIKNLNADLDKCERSDYVTLCRIVPSGGFFSFSSCSSTSGGGKLTKADCETEASKDYMFYGADGSKTLFKAKDSRCINQIDYNCHDLCK